MKKIWDKIIGKLRFLYSYWKSYVFGIIMRNHFIKIHAFILFVGYPRSGHSLIAALLDAHPNVVVSMEWDVLSHVRMGFKKHQVFYSIINDSKKFAIKEGNIWSGYSYKVREMWQGRFSEIKAIGDKFGGMTSLLIKDNPELLGKLGAVIGKSIKFIHVVRNPYDTITTMTKRYLEKKEHLKDIQSLDLLPFIKAYFDRADTVLKLKGSGNYEIFDMYHEDFIKAPQESLKELLYFIGVEPFDDYCEKCSEIVYQDVHQSRFEANWDKEIITFVEKRIQDYEFLRRYSFRS